MKIWFEYIPFKELWDDEDSINELILLPIAFIAWATLNVFFGFKVKL